MDIIRRVLQSYFGYNVQFVQNVTDIDDKVRSCDFCDPAPSTLHKQLPPSNPRILIIHRVYRSSCARAKNTCSKKCERQFKRWTRP